MPFDVPARIVRHQALNEDHFLLTLQAPPITRAVRPGQFVMLQVRQGYDPLLRRPMSVYRRLPGGRIQVLYKVVGEGTRHLSRQRAGSRLSTLGPLGNGFHIDADRGPRSARPRRAILVAGGVGIAIFPFLAEELVRRRRKTLLLYGARSRRELVARGFFRARGVGIRVATEDGSEGIRGFVTRLLEPHLRAAARDGDVELYVCGPTPMLRAVGDMSSASGVPCQMALESEMPCGIGVCLGCVVPCPANAGGPVYRRVCTEGPVFRAGEVCL